MLRIALSTCIKRNKSADGVINYMTSADIIFARMRTERMDLFLWHPYFLLKNDKTYLKTLAFRV